MESVYIVLEPLQDLCSGLSLLPPSPPSLPPSLPLSLSPSLSPSLPPSLLSSSHHSNISNSLHLLQVLSSVCLCQPTLCSPGPHHGIDLLLPFVSACIYIAAVICAHNGPGGRLAGWSHPPCSGNTHYTNTSPITHLCWIPLLSCL